MKKTRSSQASISKILVLNWVKQFCLVSIVKSEAGFSIIDAFDGNNY